MLYGGDHFYNDKFHMEEKQLVELIQSLKLAQDGYWLPMAVIAGMFSIIVLLLVSFWKKSEAYHHEKHKENDEFRKEYEKQMINIGLIVAKHEVEINHLKA